ncbi:MAG TPA: peptidase [Gammaproteobacteria bacterium]|nr:peptidase [Gammaproteobacteria bacterium]
MIILAGLLVLPHWWATAILKEFAKPRSDIPGTGAEFARHLLSNLGLENHQVELTERGDHFNPDTLTIGLTKSHYWGKSLTAMTVAAHEVGHAVQLKIGYQPLQWRSRWVRWAHSVERLGPILILLVPLIGFGTKTLAASFLSAIIGLMVLGLPAVVHLITLPVEWDASFRRSLPILDAGHYLSAKDRAAASKILLACTLTYCAASLFSILNVWRWLRIIRRT